jgi:hypothetical protein
MMARGHTDCFNVLPMGGGYEVEVNEFDFRDDNGICYRPGRRRDPLLALRARQ